MLPRRCITKDMAPRPLRFGNVPLIVRSLSWMHAAGKARDGGLAKDGTSIFFGDKQHGGNGQRYGDSGEASRFF